VNSGSPPDEMRVAGHEARCMTITHGGRRAASPRPLPSTATSGKAATGVATAAPRVRLGWQIAVVAAAVAAYFLARGATEAAYPEALRHAQALVSLERGLGVYWEPALQEALAGSPRVRAVLNAVYIYGHWPVIVATLLFLARRRPTIYLRARDTMLISGGIGLVVFVSYPVAPPRLAGLGMTDTISVASEAYRVLQPTMFTNQYAALPSLHVGWDLVIGLALAAALGASGRWRRWRWVALLMPAAMVVAVVLTANHYLVDAVAGAALTGGCWLGVGRYHRRHHRRHHRRDPRPVHRRSVAATVTRLPIPAQRDAVAARLTARPTAQPTAPGGAPEPARVAA
jgi:hypothetical protein